MTSIDTPKEGEDPAEDQFGLVKVPPTMPDPSKAPSALRPAVEDEQDAEAEEASEAKAEEENQVAKANLKKKTAKPAMKAAKKGTKKKARKAAKKAEVEAAPKGSGGKVAEKRTEKPRPKGSKRKKAVGQPRKKASGRGVGQGKGQGKQKRYSEAEKAAIIDRFNAEREAGATAHDSAKKAGVAFLTILRWEKAAGIETGRKPGRPRNSRTIATRDPKAGHLTLVTPQGYRIEGITTDELLSVLRAMQ